MADYSRAGLAAAAGVDPWLLEQQVRAGDPAALQVGALRVRRGGSLAADAAVTGERADRDLAAAFQNDGTAVHDAAASTRRGDQLLADRGDRIEETARALLDVAGALSDTSTSTAARISDLDAELDRIVGMRNGVQVTGPDPAAVGAVLDAAEQRYYAMAVDAVRVAGGRVRADLAGYDAVLRNRTARLEGLGYGAPAPAGPSAALAAVAVPAPGDAGSGPFAGLIALLAAIGAAIAAATSGAPGGSGPAPPPPNTGITQPSRPPDPNAVPRGNPARIEPNDDPTTVRAKTRQNESARILAQGGYDVEQIESRTDPKLPGVPNPDYTVEGQIFDHYDPSSSRARNIASEIGKKVERGQAERAVVNLADTPVTEQELRDQLHDFPEPGLKEVIVIDKQGRISHVYP